MEKVDLSAFYPHSPARVWKALTEAPALSTWFMPTNLEPALGKRFQLHQPGKDGPKTIQCEIFELETERRLSFTWDEGDDEPPSVVAWTLRPTDDGGTQVRLQHELVEAQSSYVLIELGASWRNVVHGSLANYLRVNRPVPIVYDEDETPSTRLAGFRNREEAPCG